MSLRRRKGRLRLLVCAFGDAGHAFPAIALARALHERGHDVTVESWGRWREAVEGLGIGFYAAEEYTVFPPPAPDGSEGPTAADAAKALAPMMEEQRPDLVVTDILTVAPALAAEMTGAPFATLVPHIYPPQDRGMPFFAFGFLPPRTAAGRMLWRRSQPVLEAGLRQGRDEYNETRERVGLPPLDRLHSGLSDELTLVATFPQLEYPRSWPGHVEVTGPMFFEVPHPEIEIPAGDDPLVLVAPSTAHDLESVLVLTALEALADEPVRVVATTNLMRKARRIEAPANATVVDWVSYSQVMPEADMVISHGGHGTSVRALAEGVPVLSCPAFGDMAENGARITWAGAGLMLPRPLVGRRTLRAATRRLLREPQFAARAAELATWSAANDGAARGAELVEQHATRKSAK